MASSNNQRQNIRASLRQLFPKRDNTGLGSRKDKKGQTHKHTRKDPVKVAKAPKGPKYSLPVRRKKDVRGYPMAAFWQQLAEIDRASTEGQFFNDLVRIKRDADRQIEKVERYRARRLANGAKAHRVLMRLRKVQAIDLYRLTAHIEPDFFGSKALQFEAVTQLYEKKARIVWYLEGLYHYLAFDSIRPGWRLTKGLNAYSKHRKVFCKLLKTHREKVKQAKWDLKRMRVRNRRRAIAETKGDEAARAYELSKGMGVNVPVAAPLLEQNIDAVPEHIIEAHANTVWD